MKKDITMRKNSFIKGAFISTFGVIIAKMLGILYIIPFHSVIGDEGGALYGYAYTIYLFFLSITTAGIPLAISKVVSEYQALGYYQVKKRVFYLGKKISLILGISSFILIFSFAPLLARFIFSSSVDSSHLADVVFVIRVISIAFVIIPILSVYRGYFSGHRIMSVQSISQVLEQFFRVLVILIGCFLVKHYFVGNVKLAVSLALLGATIGAFVSYFYLVDKYLKNKNRFSERIRDVNEPIVSNKVILKKIMVYAVPFIMIDVFQSLYNYVDMFSVVKTLVKYCSYTMNDAEIVYSMFSTWAHKFNMIAIAISSGIIISLVPNLTESLVKNKQNDINKHINKALQILFFFAFPITLGVSFLSEPIWNLFYGESLYGASVLHLNIYVGLVMALFTTVVVCLQTLKDYKGVFYSLFVGIVIKLCFNIRFVRIFLSIGIPPYYGFIVATLFGYTFSFIMGIVILKIKYKINFEEVIRSFVDILCGSLLMILILSIIKIFVPISSITRVNNFFIILFYGIMGAIIYFGFSYYTDLLQKVLGKNFLEKIKQRFIHK